MFGQAHAPPSNCNLLPLMLTCIIKTDRTKKASCVCNGSPHQKGTVTLGNTCATSLEQSRACLLWTLASLTHYQVHGANTTNYFAEAPPHVTPLHVTID